MAEVVFADGPTRRQFSVQALALAGCAGGRRPATPIAPAPLEDLTLAAGGLQRPEGVAALRDGRLVLSSSEAACTILNTDSSRRSVGRAPAANGLAIDRRGGAIIANYGLVTGVPGTLQRVDLQTGDGATLAEAINGRPLVASNMPALGPDNEIYCTHSHWRDPFNIGNVEAQGFVYKVAANGSASLVCDGIRGANGLCFSADFRHMFVARTAAGDVLRLTRAADGRYGRGERYGPQLGLAPDNLTVSDIRAMSIAERAGLGHPDGLALDREGNLWVTLPFAGKIVVLTPAGEKIVVVSDVEGRKLQSPTNLAFGGPDLRDLYIASLHNNSLWKMRAPIAGLPLPHWRDRA